MTVPDISMEYTARIQQSEGWWIGWIKEVRGVTCQEKTRQGLLDTLKITLREILEDETLDATPLPSTEDADGYEEVKITL